MAGRRYKYKKDVIKNARIGKKLSQEQLAEACGVSRQTVARWERGDRVPSLSSLERIAEAFSIPLSEFLTGGVSAACVADEPQESAACVADEPQESTVCVADEPQESAACAVDEPQEDGSPEGVVQESAAPAEAAQESTGFAETLQKLFEERRRRVSRRALAVACAVLLCCFAVGLGFTIASGLIAFSDATGDITIKSGVFSVTFFICALVLTAVCFVGTVVTGICLLKIRKKEKSDEEQTQNLDDRTCTCSDVDGDFAASADGAPPRKCRRAGDCGGASNGKQR